MICFPIYGADNIDPTTVDQMDAAVNLPIARKGALMPDAHLGYGLPIGGVLATEGAVIPYGVGMDIACRMRLTIVPHDAVGSELAEQSLQACTLFGTGKEFQNPYHHPVMDDSRWNDTSLLRNLKNRAWHQLGTSGSGNHFVEWGRVELHQQLDDLAPGVYLGILSHSGSRGPGATICQEYTKRAAAQNPAGELSWLDLSTEDGQEYWLAMNLMGDYASANHKVIHEKILWFTNTHALKVIENHHNFAWLEEHDGQELVVHRKGATPAALGERGIIPGSMNSPAFIVEGKGNSDSVRSASHGAGRALSRNQAKKRFNWDNVDLGDVKLLSAGLDEVPGAYKDIREVMAAQSDLVSTLGEFHPKIVKMAGD